MTSESAVTAACVCEEPDTILLLSYTTRSTPWSVPLMRAQAAFPAAGGRGQFVHSMRPGRVDGSPSAITHGHLLGMWQ